MKLAGSSHVAPVLKRIVSNIESNSNINNYYKVLMIFTDGIVNDIQGIVEVLHKVAMLPLSVIIIWIGGVDLSNKEYLDGDNNIIWRYR